MLFGILLLSACGEATSSPPVTPASTTVPAATGVTATATPVPPTPLVTLPPEASPTAQLQATTVPPVNRVAHPPTQPASGPGGQDYLYKSVTSNRYGQADEAYYIFEPAQPVPAKPLPVIVFLHGYGGTNPDMDGYTEWISHLVRRGNIIIFPVYQDRESRDGTRYTDSAMAGLKAAVKRLQDDSRKLADFSNVVYLGYSAGGVVATNLTVRAEKNGLPVPKALFAISPGGCANCSLFAIRNFTLDPATELAKIPAATKMLVIVGNQDVIVGKSAAEIIWHNTTQVPAANKNYLQFQTDNYGMPGLVADHGLATRRPPNAFSFYGVWKLFDGLESCSIEGKLCEVALGNTAQQRSLGQWSDGTPIKELTVLG